ncbi:MAG: hypothetical protein NT096_03775 [Proteobacteria bacterium]|nr:hypothetical protein [Pseudomonadota bacterium]
MKPLFTAFFLLFMAFMAAQRIWETFFRKKGKKGKIIQKWTFPVLSALHFIVGIGTVIEYFAVQRTINLGVSLIGLIMFFSALTLRMRVVRTLGDYHSVHIEMREEHPLIREGPYQVMRHPYYVSVMLELLGFPLVGNAYYSFLVALFVYLPFLFLRIHFEEIAMEETFGDEYRKYKAEVPGFLPVRKHKALL